MTSIPIPENHDCIIIYPASKPTSTPTPTITNTKTPTASITASLTPPPTNTPTNTKTPTPTNTKTSSQTPTTTNTKTSTNTPTQTASQTPTTTITPTSTNTLSATISSTPTRTVTSTKTPKPTPTPTTTGTLTATPTPSPTPEPTPSATPVAPLGSIITFEDYVGPPARRDGYPDGLPTKIFKNTFLHKGIILFGDEPEPICVGNYYACAKDIDNNIDNDFLGLWVFSDLGAFNPGVTSRNNYGPITGQFIQPNALVRPDGWTGLPDNEMTPIGLDGFKIKAGFFQDPGVAKLEWFDKDGNLIDSRLNTVFGDPLGDPTIGYETFIVTREDDQPRIYSFTLSLISGEEGTGYGVERIEF